MAQCLPKNESTSAAERIFEKPECPQQIDFDRGFRYYQPMPKPPDSKDQPQVVTLATDGTLPIPADLRERLSLLPGDRIALEMDGERLVLRRLPAEMAADAAPLQA